MKPLGRFMGIEFYVDQNVPTGTVVFENAKPSEADMDFACGGTGTEPQEPPPGPDPMAITRSIARGS